MAGDLVAEQGDQASTIGEATGASLEHWRLATHFIFSADLPLNYLVNPKSGCSTILEHLWAIVDGRRGVSTFTGSPHRGGPWDKVGDLSHDGVAAVLAKPTVSVVRNPYTRALSGYLSKVGDRRDEDDPYIWNVFRKRFELADDTVPSFAQYLEYIETEAEGARDRHWASQCSNLLQPWAPVDRIFYLEHFAFFEAFLDRFDARGVQRSPSGFRGSEMLLKRYLTPEIVARISRLYAVDFETFGYSFDPAVQAPVWPIDHLKGSPDGFLAILQSFAKAEMTKAFGCVDFLRDTRVAGWLRYAGDPEGIQVVLRSPVGETVAKVDPAGDDPTVHLFEVYLPEDAAAVAAAQLLNGEIKVVVRTVEGESESVLWEPVRLAGEIARFDAVAMRRFRHALPMETIELLAAR